ncbi:hypothetical protein EG68_05210 [Paragonimus skrjabini miyazakii]|uniref:Uncharacterized protein n=1 Tax=Paragonimus skrjabini miyazakii TaxID=59628 RepID=A0A8S9Z1T4_9TREM|nr:hypothetical protein EG68_05210 [Paragonimus skrjabini miyazakii]
MLRCCFLGLWIALSFFILVVQTVSFILANNESNINSFVLALQEFPSSEAAARDFCTIYQGTMVAPMCRNATEGFAVFVNCLNFKQLWISDGCATAPSSRRCCNICRDKLHMLDNHMHCEGCCEEFSRTN